MNYDEMKIDCLNRSLPLKPIKTEAEGYICYYCANKVKIKEKYCDVCGMEIDWGNIKEENKKGDTMEWVNFKVKEGEREKLKNDAHAHRMNISEYLRFLIEKERQYKRQDMRKEDEGK